MTQRKDGRWSIVCRDGTKVLWARALASNELGRPLRDDEVVHHRNGDRSDDRPENLMVTTRSEHARLHAVEFWAPGGSLRNRRRAA